jgi:hypothetical protein
MRANELLNYLLELEEDLYDEENNSELISIMFLNNPNDI